MLAEVYIVPSPLMVSSSRVCYALVPLLVYPHRSFASFPNRPFSRHLSLSSALIRFDRLITLVALFHHILDSLPSSSPLLSSILSCPTASDSLLAAHTGWTFSPQQSDYSTVQHSIRPSLTLLFYHFSLLSMISLYFALYNLIPEILFV